MREEKQKGITVISLIITIILMIILASVTINIAIGKNGLINKSKQAVNKAKLAQTEETIKMDLLSAYIDAELNGKDKPSDETIKQIIENNGGTIDENDPNLIHTPNGEIKLDDILNESSSGSQNPEEINKTVEELNNQINDLKRQLEEEKSRREGLETQIGELQSQVASWKQKAEDGDITIEEKNTQISSLNDQITAKNQELDDKNNEIQSLNENITTLTGQKGALETQVANLQEHVNKKDEEIANKEEIIASKETTITTLNAEIEELNTSITDLNSELNTAKSDKEALETEVTTLTNEKNTLSNELADKNTEISNLNDQITAKNEEITTKTNTINNLNGQITTLTNQKKSLETQVTNLNTQVANLQKKQATGTAVASDVLAGKTFSNSSGTNLKGTMPNMGKLDLNFTGSGTKTITPGYYSGGTITYNPISGNTVDDVIDKITGKETENTELLIGGKDVVIPSGFTISTDTASTVDEGIVVKDSKGNEWVWVPCTEYTRKDFGKQSGSYSDYSETLTKEQSDSIKKYKGFYIGRYEAGKESEKVVIKQNVPVYNNISFADCKSKSRSFAVDNGYNTSKMFTVLCSSYAWDSALKFIEKINSTYPTNSTQGNYNSSMKYTGLTTPVCNIYDMGGNAWEFTTESYNNGSAPYVRRGGSYADKLTSDFQASYRGNDPGGRMANGGFRLTLFLK